MKLFIANIKTVKTGKIVVDGVGIYAHNLQDAVKKLRKKYPIKTYIISLKEVK